MSEDRSVMREKYGDRLIASTVVRRAYSLSAGIGRGHVSLMSVLELCDLLSADIAEELE
jgi:hypothetical protein